MRYSLSATVRVVGWSSLNALMDLRAVYSWRTWTLGWLARCLTQVAAFGLLGAMVADGATQAYLVVGTAIVAGLASVSLVVQSTAWERQAGTLPFLVVSGAPPFLVFAGRGLQWLVDGTVVCLLALMTIPALFGLGTTVAAIAQAVPLILVTYATMYAFSLILAAAILGIPGARNLASNVSTAFIALFCGVQVTLTFWPAWLQQIAQLLPLTHGVSAIRTSLSGRGFDWVQFLAQCALLGFYFSLASAAFTLFVRRGRRRGSIEFGE